MRAEPFLQEKIHVDLPQKSLIFKAILSPAAFAPRFAPAPGNTVR